MKFRNPFDIEPIRPVPLPGAVDPTGELQPAAPDALRDSEQAPPPPAGEPLAVEFLGDQAEYARLWYINVLLTLVTFGLYSPWAKVAARRYFASHTLVDGVPFAYHGEPLPILKGRLLAVAIITVGWMLAGVVPAVEPILLAAAIVAAPWFILRTLEFTGRNYAWRGIRFGFSAHWRAAAAAVLPLLVWPGSAVAFRLLEATAPGRSFYLAAVLVPILAFSLLWPLTVAAAVHLRFAGTRFGTMRFTLAASKMDFYRLYYRGLGPVVGAMVGGIYVIEKLTSFLLRPDIALMVNAFLAMCGTAALVGIARGRRFNLGLHRLVGDNGRIRFRSSLDPKALSLLYVRNALWVALTAGLASPWRRVLTTRYRLSHVTVYVDGPLTAIGPDAAPTPGALGESLAEGLGVDLSL